MQSFIPEDSDYAEEANTTIDFFPGDFSGVRRCTNIAIKEDDILEYNEAFNVILKENSNRLDIQTDRNSTQIIIMEDDDCKSAYLCMCSSESVITIIQPAVT